MPVILEIFGWRLFFYANEGSEPTHIHARKGETECKFWILVDEYDIEEAFSSNLKTKQRREIRRIIFSHFDYIVTQWDEFKKRGRK
jgi:hypothetical protein